MLRTAGSSVRAAAVVALAAYAVPALADDDHGAPRRSDPSVQLGPRPFYLVDGMDSGWLKTRLAQCKSGPFYRTDFSIGHRGAALQFPEHTKESYQAGARQGAGIVECDTTFTADGKLVCRHSECDLHTTTNIVATDLNAKCTVPWTGPNQRPAPRCCTSDITLAEFKTLRGKMDSSTPGATTAEGYLGGTASWRTDLYTGRGTLMTLSESLALNEKLGVKHTPELKSADNPDRMKALFGSQAGYAQAIVDELRDAGVDPRRVWLQSFNLEDVLYWIKNAPEFGRQAVYLDDIDPTANPPIPRLTNAELQQLRQNGVRIFAPPMPALLDVDGQRPRRAVAVREGHPRAGLDIITWTFERADLRRGRVEGRLLLLLRPAGEADPQGLGHVRSARRAGPPGEDPRHLLRLAGDRDLLRELHGHQLTNR